MSIRVNDKMSIWASECMIGFVRTHFVFMKIISVLNEKGGTGKSTVATNLATILHREGKRVVLLDCDPQGTSRDWRDASPDDADLPPVLGVDRPQMLASSLNGINAEIVIIDSPAKAESMSAAIVREPLHKSHSRVVHRLLKTRASCLATKNQ